MSACVCVRRMMNYICGEIFQVERVNIIETEKEKRHLDSCTYIAYTHCRTEWDRLNASNRRAQGGYGRSPQKRGQASSTRLIGMSSELNGTQTLLLFSLSSLFFLSSMMSCASQQKIKPGYGPTFQRDLQTVCVQLSLQSRSKGALYWTALPSLSLSLPSLFLPTTTHHQSFPFRSSCALMINWLR